MRNQALPDVKTFSFASEAKAILAGDLIETPTVNRAVVTQLLKAGRIEQVRLPQSPKGPLFASLDCIDKEGEDRR